MAARTSTTHVIEIETGIGEPAFIPLSMGQELQPISVGKKGMWRLESARVLDVHAFVYFDGSSLFLQSADENAAAVVDGVAVGKAWTELHAPCKIEIGATKLRYRALGGPRESVKPPAPAPAPPAVPTSPSVPPPGIGLSRAESGQPAPPPRPPPSSPRLGNAPKASPSVPVSFPKGDRPFSPGELAAKPDDESTRVGAPASRDGSQVLAGSKRPPPAAESAPRGEIPTKLEAGRVPRTEPTPNVGPQGAPLPQQEITVGMPNAPLPEMGIGGARPASMRPGTVPPSMPPASVPPGGLAPGPTTIPGYGGPIPSGTMGTGSSPLGHGTFGQGSFGPPTLGHGSVGHGTMALGPGTFAPGTVGPDGGPFTTSGAAPHGTLGPGAMLGYGAPETTQAPSAGIGAKFKALSGPQKILVFLMPFCLLSLGYLVFGNPQGNVGAGVDGGAGGSASSAPTSASATASGVASAPHPLPNIPSSPFCPPGYVPLPGYVVQAGVPCVPGSAAPPVPTGTNDPNRTAPTAHVLGAKDAGPTPPPPTAGTATNPPGPTTAPAHKTLERQAVDAVAIGDNAKAAAIYEELLKKNPDNRVYAEAARILRAKLDAGAP